MSDTLSNPGADEQNLFARLASYLHDLGLAVIPCGGEDGKKPLVKWATWERRPPVTTVESWSRRDTFAGANIGMLTGLSDITIVDIDAIKHYHHVEACLGRPGIVVATPSLGLHFWYRSSGEPCQNLRRYGLDIDIKGLGGFVVIPPSIRPSGEHKGRSYQFTSGSWEDLHDLRPIKPGGLDTLIGTDAPVGEEGPIRIGARNNKLFRAGLRLVGGCASLEEFTILMKDLNEKECIPPLPEAEFDKTVRSAWGYHIRGLNWAHKGGLRLTAHEFDRMPDPDCLWLHAHLLRAHGSRGDSFAIAARAMAQHDSARGLSEKRIRTATEQLVQAGFLVREKSGGRGPGDVALYRFSTPM